MGSSRRERKVVAACHALSHLICSAAPDSVPDCEAFVYCETKGSPKAEEPRIGVAVGGGTSTSLGGGKTEAKIRSWNAVIVTGGGKHHGRLNTANSLERIILKLRARLDEIAKSRAAHRNLKEAAMAGRKWQHYSIRALLHVLLWILAFIASLVQCRKECLYTAIM